MRFCRVPACTTGRYGRWDQLNANPFVAAYFRNGEPVGRFQLPQYAVHVVLYGLFGKIQAAGHFFVRKTLLNQDDKLLFPAAESEAVFEMQAGYGRLVSCHPMK